MKKQTKDIITKLESDVYRNKKRYTYIQGDFVVYGVYLSTNAKWVYTIILFHKIGEHATAFPSLKTLAKLSNLSITSVQAAVAELEHFGWIDKESGKSKFLSEGNRNNIYNPTVPTEGTHDDKIVLSPSTKLDGEKFRKEYNKKRKGKQPKIIFPKTSIKTLEEIHEDKSIRKSEMKTELKRLHKGYEVQDEYDAIFGGTENEDTSGIPF